MNVHSALGLSLLLVAACGGNASSTSDGKQPVSAEQTSEVDAGDQPACNEHETRTCSTSANSSSVQSCQRSDDGVLEWGPCQLSAASSSTPLVLVFDGAPVDFRDAPARATFDLAGDGASHVTSWPSARTPWLALDRDGNGRIDDGSELFGSMTRLGSGVRAKNGFEALAELDSNHDGAITAEDDGFARLVVWSDADGDRATSIGEQRPASSSIVRINLAFHSQPHCSSTGNCEIERATFVYRDASGEQRTGEVVDVHLRHR